MTTAAQSQLHGLRVEPSSHDIDALPHALNAMLRAYGAAVDPDEGSAVLGVAFMTTFAERAAPPARWNTYGLHAFLEPAARLYGLELRDLHPPSAAPLPHPPPEYELHFRDSYLPFIRAALARGEPVLAWMGWPPPCETGWGVVTGWDERAQRCIGQTFASRGRPTPLPNAAVQVYTVQGFAPAGPTAVEVLSAVVERANLTLSNRIPDEFGVVTGPTALAELRRSVIADDTPSPPGLTAYRRVLDGLHRGRSAALTVLKGIGADAGGAMGRAHQALCELCTAETETVARLLDTTGRADASEPEQMKERLVDCIDALIEAESHCRESLPDAAPTIKQRAAADGL